MDAHLPPVLFVDRWWGFVGLGRVPDLDGGVQTVLQGCVEFALCDGAFHGRPGGSGAKPYDPAPVRWDQPFFGLMERSAVKISWITELSLSLLMPMSSDAAAKTTQNAGWAMISSRCMVMNPCTSILAIAVFENCQAVIVAAQFAVNLLAVGLHILMQFF